MSVSPSHRRFVALSYIRSGIREIEVHSNSEWVDIKDGLNTIEVYANWDTERINTFANREGNWIRKGIEDAEDHANSDDLVRVKHGVWIRPVAVDRLRREIGDAQ